MILVHFKFIFHTYSILNIRELIAFLSLLMFERLEMSMLLIVYEISLIKLSFSSLFFTIENLYIAMFFSAIRMDTVIEA